MGSENDYEAGHVISIQAMTIKILIIMRSFVWAFSQSYLGRHCSHVSYMRHFVLTLYFTVKRIAALKSSCCSRRFSERALPTYQVIVLARVSTHE